ncbi:MAG: hypothetical protein COT16_00930 [Elusimicrobia bacterium CG08_land_8_20_14_0_20_44_26]|nr:MAG: hypothetical protein COT16_00930 [Elusimicrobia bacterium CG08_land_8_20_14_0_20_44_26]
MNFLVTRFSSLGDVIMAGPVFENIKLNYPGSFVYFLTKKTYADVFLQSPFVDRIIALEDYSPLKLILLLRRLMPDSVFDLHSSARSILTDIFFPGRVSRVRSLRRGRKKILRGEKIVIPDVIDRYLDTLGRKDIAVHTKKTGLFLSDEEIAAGKKILAGLGIPPAAEIICVAPQSKWLNKEWPHFRSFFELAARPGRFFLIAGEDYDGAEKILPESRFYRNFVKNLCGQLDLRMLFTLIKLSGCVISMDSGAAHAAAALDRPLIVFFGPTTPAFGFAPPSSKILEADVPCRPCHLHGGNVCERGDRVCLASISEAQLLREVEKILKEK